MHRRSGRVGLSRTGDRCFERSHAEGVPYPTLIINLISCFTIGCIIATHPGDIETALVCTGF